MPAEPEGDKSWEFIAIDDFSPGIWDEWYSASGIQSAPDGAAQANGTYRCCSSASGALIPAPRKIGSAPLSNPVISAGTNPVPNNESQANSNTTNAYLAGDGFVHVLAMKPIALTANVGNYTSGQTSANVAAFPEAVALLYQFFFNPAGNTFNGYGVAQLHKVSSYIQNATSPLAGAVTDANGVVLIGYGDFTRYTSSTYLFQILNQADQLSSSTPPTGSFIVYGTGSMDVTRANNTATTTPGNATLATVYYPTFLTSSSTRGLRLAYPKNSTPTVDNTDTIIFASSIISHCLAHQDRIVAFHAPNSNQVFAQFGASQVTDATELMEYTAVNNYGASGGTLQVVSENPTGYGSWVSMNANQLFLVKQVGGGVSITGAMESPTVTRLPGIASTYGTKNLGCMLTSGQYMYGTANGIHAWSGGDTAQLVSPQLSPTVWIPQTPGFNIGVVGTFAYQPPFVFAPNNLLFDTRKKGWWQYENPAVASYAFHQPSVSGNVLATPAVIPMVGGIDHEAIAWFDPRQGANSYQWISQPLARTRGRLMDYRGITLVAAGSGTIAITLLGLGDDPIFSEPVNVNTTTSPVAVQIPTRCKGTDVVVRINSIASNPLNPAPVVYRIQLAAREDQTARNLS